MRVSEPRLTQLSKEIRSAERTIHNLQQGLQQRRKELSAVARQPFFLNDREVRIHVQDGEFVVEVFVDGRLARRLFVTHYPRGPAGILARSVLYRCDVQDDAILVNVRERIVNALGA